MKLAESFDQDVLNRLLPESAVADDSVDVLRLMQGLKQVRAFLRADLRFFLILRFFVKIFVKIVNLIFFLNDALCQFPNSINSFSSISLLCVDASKRRRHGMFSTRLRAKRRPVRFRLSNAIAPSCSPTCDSSLSISYRTGVCTTRRCSIRTESFSVTLTRRAKPICHRFGTERNGNDVKGRRR